MVGMPCDMDRIMAIAKQAQMKVVEDSCQCDGGSYKGKRTGSIGDMGAFSFNDFKIITCGEGGAVVTNDRTLFERALVYSDSGANFRPYAKDLSFPPFLGVPVPALRNPGRHPAHAACRSSRAFSPTCAATRPRSWPD